MWVKICGNTNLEDAICAAELGADAVGFVFAKSKRQVTVAQVAAITPHLPAGVERVGVFDSRGADEIAAAACAAGVTAVQLHGDLDDRLVESLTKRLPARMSIIQTLHWTVAEGTRASTGLTVETRAVQLTRQLKRIAELGLVDRVLIDSKVGAASGGTGVAYDWSAARDVFASAPSGLRLIVAGGLRPGNVESAVAQLAPWGVDVSSGVETQPGTKDHAMVELFIQNARGTQTP